MTITKGEAAEFTKAEQGTFDRLVVIIEDELQSRFVPEFSVDISVATLENMFEPGRITYRIISRLILHYRIAGWNVKIYHPDDLGFERVLVFS